MRILNLLLLLALMLPGASPAETVCLTIYNDGISCPGNCDAHVVFHTSFMERAALTEREPPGKDFFLRHAVLAPSLAAMAYRLLVFEWAYCTL
ncbi:MAG: hypothetical protein PHR16_00725 [Methylovulum sp.]|nr:hypothetical protein [Methylovulum sp.]